ncbi:MAG: DUF21 domain-containing protein [Dethiosulfatibacter sp.]|nr:DUF21 domain-containing protein [Dethiosulfatibacter sp.]
MVGSGSKKAKLVLELADDYDRILSTILIGNNIVNIASASLATVIIVCKLQYKLGLFTTATYHVFKSYFINSRKCCFCC